MQKIIDKIKYFQVSFFNRPLLNALNLLPNNGNITLCDVGAAGEIEPRWRPYKKKLNYIGFEPDKRSREKILNKKKDFKEYKILPFALANEHKTTNLFLCRKPRVSSLYEPNLNFLERFPNPKRFDVMQTEQMQCVTLDSIDLPKVDFLKIDIQGAENDVIKGASSKLELAFGLEVEVEFLELYKRQPLFGDVCSQLSDLGFEFFDFINLGRWERDIFSGHGQCIYADAIFFRTPESLIKRNMDVDSWSSYFSVLLIYNRFDLIYTSLSLLPTNIKDAFKEFKKALEKARKRDAFIRRTSSAFNRIISLTGSNYRIHLIR